MKPVTAKMMVQIDEDAREKYGIPAEVLMENAGKAVVGEISNDIMAVSNRKTAIFCGKGNNGGDGYVVARHLFLSGIRDITVFSSLIDHIKDGPNKIKFRQLDEVNINLVNMDKLDLEEEVRREDFGVFIDAVFGTGFTGELRRDIAGLLRVVNNIRSFHVAVDIPSGLDATTGVADRACFKADKTVTFGLPKIGQIINDGPFFCGDLIVKNIGFPPELLEKYGTK